MSVVSVINTTSYSEDVIYRAVCGHFDRLGVAGDIRPGMRILIKPNLLYAKRPEFAVTTHYSLIAAVIRALRELGAENITVADSSGGLYNAEHMNAVYSSCGLKRPGIEEYLNHDFTFAARHTQEGFAVKSFNLITPVLNADYIINLPKLKTHAMTTVSAGVKNLFGTIPGLQKPDMHCRFPELPAFARMLCELALTVKPDVTIIDAVDSMEGNGPGGGTVKHTGITLSSRDVFALDAAAVGFMGLEPLRIPHLMAARDMGLYPDDVVIEGDGLTPCSPPFRLPDTTRGVGFTDSIPKIFRAPAQKVMTGLLRSFPSVDKSKCIGCGRCSESCPQHIISITNKKASMPRRGCISCFCCQEMCPVHAISAKRGLRGL
ncbi:MAG: DUF362 domain-containing protein [Oscillospiraceae bacterium]